MATNEEVLFPKVLVIPTLTPLSGTIPPAGSLSMSGAKLYVYTTKWELITSA
jgi:hypothetical protein